MESLEGLADGLARVADEMRDERARLGGRLHAMTWQGLAAEAVRGTLSRRLGALGHAEDRHRSAAAAVREHARVVEHRQRALAGLAARVEGLLDG